MDCSFSAFARPRPLSDRIRRERSRDILFALTRSGGPVPERQAGIPGRRGPSVRRRPRPHRSSRGSRAARRQAPALRDRVIRQDEFPERRVEIGAGRPPGRESPPARDRRRSRRPRAGRPRCPARTRRCSPRANRLRARPRRAVRARRRDGAARGRPEKRVTARSKLPQKKCTGLALPRKPLRKSLKTRSTCTSARQKRCAAAAS